MADFEWCNSDDTVKLAPVSEGGVGFEFNDVIGGTATAIQEWHFKNNSGQNEEGLLVSILCRKVSEDPFVAENEEFVENKYLQARIKGDSAWQLMGAGSYLIIPSLLDGGFIAIEARILSLESSQVAVYQVKVRVERKPYIALGNGFFEGIGNGIVSGLGDSSRNFLIDFANVVQNPGGADSQVLVPKVFGWVNNLAGAVKEDLVDIGTDDSASAVPAGANKFYAALTFDGSSVGIVKGLNGNPPVKPVIDESLVYILAWVKQDSTGLIQDADIENVWNLDRFAVTTNGLNIVIHHGIAQVNNNLLYHNKVTNFALTDNETNYLFLRNDRNFTLNITGEIDQEKEMPLYIFFTVAGVITQIVDLRRFIGVQVEKLDIYASGGPLLAISDVDYAHYNGSRKAYIISIYSSVIGGTGAGDTKVDINKSVDGSAFTTIFDDQNLRPIIQGDDFHFNDAWPTDRVLEKNTRLEIEVDDIPATGPSKILITLNLEIP